MNSITIKGRLTKDPELRNTQSGTAVCTVNVAVDRPYSKDKETDFFTVVFWRQTAEFVSKYFVKGQEILVQGEMQSRKYEDKEGNNRVAWEVKADRVEFCGSRGQGDESAPAPAATKGGGKSTKKAPPPTAESEDNSGEDGNDGELPF
ncbi:single-stranded DNA-binding protein [Clostridiaceae bacterium]|nr:single-stranded DNA-binding protein [Clostridiaceae bacterium]